VGERSRESIDWLIEKTTKGNMGERWVVGKREVINWLVETYPKSKVGERRRKDFD
jgi:hypothetical protein